MGVSSDEGKARSEAMLSETSFLKDIYSLLLLGQQGVFILVSNVAQMGLGDGLSACRDGLSSQLNGVCTPPPRARGK